MQDAFRRLISRAHGSGQPVFIYNESSAKAWVVLSLEQYEKLQSGTSEIGETVAAGDIDETVLSPEMLAEESGFLVEPIE